MTIETPYRAFTRPVWGFNWFFTESWGRATWGRVCGRAKLGAGTLRCLHLCWRLPWNWSDAEQLGRCPKPHKGRCPLTLQGADEKGRSPPLDPFARLSWSHFHAPSACSFWWLRLSPCLLPQLSVKNLLIYLLRFGRCVPISRNAITPAAMPPYSLSSWLQPYPAITAFACRR